MNKLTLHTTTLILTLIALFPGGNKTSAETVLPALITDSVPRPSNYQQYLDSAVFYTGEGKYQEAANAYLNGLNAYKEHYRHQIGTVNHQLAAAYEMDKKEQELEQLNQTLSLRKTQTILFTVLIIILLTALILLYFIQKYRLKAINQKRLQKENETTVLKLEKEKKELEAQLNTLQAAKYQKELLAGTMLVEYKNKVMEDLRLFFDTHPTLSKYKSDLARITGEENIPEPDNQEFATDLQQIHPTFYAHLQKQANNKLTPLDLKYCRMIYLRMSSKEMADILQVDPKTIRVTKYRLKQKLGLGKEDDLNGFIEGMA